MFSEIQILSTNWFNWKKPARAPSPRPKKRDIQPNDAVIVSEEIGTSASVEIVVFDSYELMILSSVKRPSPRVQASIDELESGGGYRFSTVAEMLAFLESA